MAPNQPNPNDTTAPQGLPNLPMAALMSRLKRGRVKNTKGAFGGRAKHNRPAKTAEDTKQP